MPGEREVRGAPKQEAAGRGRGQGWATQTWGGRLGAARASRLLDAQRPPGVAGQARPPAAMGGPPAARQRRGADPNKCASGPHLAKATSMAWLKGQLFSV